MAVCCKRGLLLAQVVKTDATRRVAEISRRVVLGSAEAVVQVLTTASGGHHQITTASIARLNATVRAGGAPRARRTRALLAHGDARVTTGMFLVGTAYTFVWRHESLRLHAEGPGLTWHERTPAMAAGLTDHPWTMDELLCYPAPPAPQAAGPPAQNLSRESRGMITLTCGSTEHRAPGILPDFWYSIATT